MRAFGAELIEFGRDFDEAKDEAHRLAGVRNLHFVPSFDPLLVRGVATYALEFFRAVPDLDAVYVPIGMGSGICGLITARDLLGLKTEIIGVVARNAPCIALSFEAGRPMPTNAAQTFADGMACRVPEPRRPRHHAEGCRPHRSGLAKTRSRTPSAPTTRIPTIWPRALAPRRWRR